MPKCWHDRVTLHHKLKKYGWSRRGDRSLSLSNRNEEVANLAGGPVDPRLLDWLRQSLQEKFQVNGRYSLR